MSFKSSWSSLRATKKTRVESVERVENESLWQMYQFRREILKKNLCNTEHSITHPRHQLAACDTKQG